MNGRRLIELVKQERFPDGLYAVFGSGPLALAGIRTVSDIDIVVTGKLYNELKQRGWQEKVGLNGGKMLCHDVFEVSASWEFGDYRPSLEALLASAERTDGVAFLALDEVKKWKLAMGRDKDHEDIRLIDEYLATHA